MRVTNSTALAVGLALVPASCAAPRQEPAPVIAVQEPAPAPVPAPATGDAPAAAPAPAPAPQSSPEEAKARKAAKIQRYLDLSRWKESFVAGLESNLRIQIKYGLISEKFIERFKEALDYRELSGLMTGILDEVYDEPTIDGMIAFLESDAGRKYAEAQPRLMALSSERVGPVGARVGKEVMARLVESGEADDIPAMKNLKAAKRSSGETAAIATLRNLASCQAQIQTSGMIDCDNDGIGEYGTFLEMTGSAAVRKGYAAGNPPASDFSLRGGKVNPPILSPALAEADAEGVVRKYGYCYRIFLPDSASPAGFVHETGPAAQVALAGGTGRIGVDLAETTWCAYAWPEKPGDTGERVFFVNQSGDVLQSANGKNRWGGAKAPPPDAAFLGTGITAEVAVGTLGRDGEIWKVTH